MGNQSSFYLRTHAGQNGNGGAVIRFQLRNLGLPTQIGNPAIVQEDANGTVAGAGDLLLGVKWRFLNDEHSRFQLGTYPRVLVPTGDQSRGLGEGRSAFLLPVVAQKNWGKWTLYGNVGFWWQTAAEERNYSYAGAVIEREINERLELGVELFGNSPKERDARSDIVFNLGGTLKLREHFNLLFSGGRDIIGDTRAMGYLGLQIVMK